MSSRPSRVGTCGVGVALVELCAEQLRLAQADDGVGVGEGASESLVDHLTARWPKQQVDFTGKRVGIVGTGATAVQVIPVVAEQVAHLTVF